MQSLEDWGPWPPGYTPEGSYQTHGGNFITS